MKTSFVFPGQGSQSVGMLQELAQTFPLIEETFAVGSEQLGYDTWALAQTGPAEKIDLTEVTQPLLLLASISVWRVWLKCGGPKPSILAGHSLGEYSALVAAGSLQLSDAVMLVRNRGQYMQQTTPEGKAAMAVILGLTDEEVGAICAEAQQAGEVAPANFNAPGQVVIGGEKAAVEKAGLLAKAKGCRRVLPVKMSVASHCPMMRPAADLLAADLDSVEVLPPSIPVVNNLAGQVEREPHRIRNALKMQIFNPVMWTEVVASMVDAGIGCMIECGPGKVLTGLNKRIAKELKCENINDVNSLSLALAGKDIKFP